MNSLVCQHVSFAWPDGQDVLTDLDLAVPPGRTGLVGRNGSGKSTLLRLLAGELNPTSGHVHRDGTVAHLPQQLALDATRSVASVLGVDTALAALDRLRAGAGTAADVEEVGDDWGAEERALAIVSDLGFVVDGEPRAWLARRIAALSGGEVVLLGLAALFLGRPDVLLLDEPTTNLDRDARARLHRALEGWRRRVVVVSHDEELLDLMDTTAELRDGRVRLFGGGFGAYTDALEVEQEAARRGVRAVEADLRRQRRDLAESGIKLDRRQRYGRTAYEQKRQPKAKMQELKRSAQVSAAKLRGDHQAEVARAADALVAAEDLVRDDDLIRVDLPATAVPAGRDVARLDRVVLRHGPEVSLHVRGPERVGLVGPNGSGKTTLLQTLVGDLAPRSGEVALHVPTRVLPQRLQVLDKDDTVLRAVGRYAPSAEDRALRAGLARFRLGAELVERAVATLSGGERFRATLAALLLAEPAPQLLVLDEPTNSLDLDSVAQLVSALRGYRGALLVSSHDERFLGRLGLDRVLDLGGPDGPVVHPV